MSAISIERVFQRARRLAYDAGQNYDPVREAEEKKRYLSLVPALKERGLREHPTRFQPLYDVLGEFEEPLRELRDRLYPSSPIFRVDTYDRLYPFKLSPSSGSNTRRGRLLYPLRDPNVYRTMLVVSKSKILPEGANEHNKKGFLCIQVVGQDQFRNHESDLVAPINSQRVDVVVAADSAGAHQFGIRDRQQLSGDFVDITDQEQILDSVDESDGFLSSSQARWPFGDRSYFKKWISWKNSRAPRQVENCLAQLCYSDILGFTSRNLD